MIEYPDVEERKRALARLKGIEDRVWVQVEGCAKVYAIADEDLERETEEKTSSVHFLRFELNEEMAKALKYGVGLAIGVDHPEYVAAISTVPAAVRNSLAGDLA
jgi:DNA-binding helix-hairpin-helix protein with protein kinase domain